MSRLSAALRPTLLEMLRQSRALRRALAQSPAALDLRLDPAQPTLSEPQAARGRHVERRQQESEAEALGLAPEPGGLCNWGLSTGPRERVAEQGEHERLREEVHEVEQAHDRKEEGPLGVLQVCG